MSVTRRTRRKIMLKQHLLFLRIRILPTYHLKGHRPISLQIRPCWLRIRLSNLTPKWFLCCLLVHILLKNVPNNKKKPATTKKTEPSYFMCEELCVRSPVTPKRRKMVLCSVNLLEFQKRNELEFQTQSVPDNCGVPSLQNGGNGLMFC